MSVDARAWIAVIAAGIAVVSLAWQIVTYRSNGRPSFRVRVAWAFEIRDSTSGFRQIYLASDRPLRVLRQSPVLAHVYPPGGPAVGMAILVQNRGQSDLFVARWLLLMRNEQVLQPDTVDRSAAEPVKVPPGGRALFFAPLRQTEIESANLGMSVVTPITATAWLADGRRQTSGLRVGSGYRRATKWLMSPRVEVPAINYGDVLLSEAVSRRPRVRLPGHGPRS